MLGWLGIGLIMAGAFVVARERVAETGWGVGWTDSVFGLGTAVAWAISPVLIKEGLDGLSSPLLGLTLGMAAAVLAYAVLVVLRGVPSTGAVGSRAALGFKLQQGAEVASAQKAAAVVASTAALAGGGVAVKQADPRDADRGARVERAAASAEMPAPAREDTPPAPAPASPDPEPAPAPVA